jgi:hypothetical protein
MADITMDVRARAGEMYFGAPITNHVPQPTMIKLKEMYSHPAWHGSLNGMDCEDVLRGNSPGTYILRQEGSAADNTHYYISWVVDKEKGYYGHRPFCFHTDPFTGKIGWLHRNGHVDHLEDLGELIPIMMHQKDGYFPLKKHSPDCAEKS